MALLCFVGRRRHGCMLRMHTHAQLHKACTVRACNMRQLVCMLSTSASGHTAIAICVCQAWANQMLCCLSRPWHTLTQFPVFAHAIKSPSKRVQIIWLSNTIEWSPTDRGAPALVWPGLLLLSLPAALPRDCRAHVTRRAGCVRAQAAAAPAEARGCAEEGAAEGKLERPWGQFGIRFKHLIKHVIVAFSGVANSCPPDQFRPHAPLLCLTQVSPWLAVGVAWPSQSNPS